MPSKLKTIATNTFSGGMNTDIASELMPNNVARYILNCNTMSTATGNVGIVTNLKGNSLIDFTLPEGDNLCIGVAKDEESNVFFYFLWNSEGYHGIYRYDGLLNKIDRILLSIDDTGGIDILRFNKDNLILMANVVQNNLLYWVQKDNPARKINIDKALDKSDTGYGVITEEFISAYKLAPYFAPKAAYFSDTNVDVNRLYGTLFKFASRYIYDDGEVSNWSDYSNAPTPAKEAFTGVNFIPTDNNGINVIVQTGSKIVEKIEIAMQYTIDGGFSNWVLVTSLDKEKLEIGDDGEYTYKFYNDTAYPEIDQEKIIRPYSFLPDQPLLQEFTNNSMIYGNFKEGFPDVDIDMSFDDVEYTPLFLDDSVENKFNEPYLGLTVSGTPYDDYFRAGNEVTYVNGTTGAIFPNSSTPVRARRFKLIVGEDVKEGNNFVLSFTNGFDNIQLSYTANNTDNASTVANKLKQLLIGTGKILRKTPDLVDTNIYTEIDESGNKGFYFIIRATPDKQYLNGSSNVNPVNVVTLKDTGQSVSNIKLGSTTKYGIVYEDFQGRRSLVYTDVDLIIKVDTQNNLDGIKKVNLILNINHTPPVWAKAFQIVRTNDLTYSTFIQMLIQKVTEVDSTDSSSGEYLDLIVGSLFTYQKIHPNTTLRYEFKKGDRIRFISKSDGSYYDFFETEILEYNPTVTTEVNQNVTLDGTTTVTVADASVDNIGKYIRVNGYERLITGSNDSTTYTVDSPIGVASSDAVLGFEIIDRRGSIRIRKPSIVIGDESLVEIFTPSLITSLGDKQFYHFNKKFDIIDAGLETRAHFGDIQPQTNAQPAKISITEGTVYVRSREMPTSNGEPAQVVIKTVEDPAYSDFYFSTINDNGKTNVEDQGIGVVHFGSRLRFSNNYIEDTRINGLNDFDNLDREDYNDKYGDIMLIVFADGSLLTFKQLKDCIIPVFQTIIQDNAGVELLGTSSKLLNNIRYYSHDGGIGNNPESYSNNANQHYHVSANSGCFVRLSGDGLTPISEIFFFDSEAKRLLSEAYNNNAKIFTQFDVDNSVMVAAIMRHEEFTFNNTFNSADWKAFNDRPNEDTPLELLTPPTEVEVSLDGQFVTITSDDFVGQDSFTYRGFVEGIWVEKKICLTYKDLPNRQTAWRPRFIDAVCETEEGENTGKLIFITLEQYYIDNGEGTGETKLNSVGDPDYASPIEDLDTCPFDGTIYYSVEKSGFATRNNCPSGQVGSEVEYIVPEGAYQSVIDQETADQKAQDDVDDNKQAYANSTGTCTATPSFGNDAKTQYFTKNDCEGGLFGSSVGYTVPANTYYASTKAAANAERDADISANGQAYANTNGTCSALNTFTLELVIYPDFKGGGYLTTDTRGKSLDIYRYPNSLGGTVEYSFMVSSNIINNSVVHTYSISFTGSSIETNIYHLFLKYIATTTSGTDQIRIYKNSVLFGTQSRTVAAGVAGTQYQFPMTPGVPMTVLPSDIVRIEHGTAPITYYSAEKSSTATKNDCESGFGSEETLVVPAGTFTSTIDQDDADQQAQDYADANAQAYANTVGTCTPDTIDFDITSQIAVGRNIAGGDVNFYNSGGLFLTKNVFAYDDNVPVTEPASTTTPDGVVKVEVVYGTLTGGSANNILKVYKNGVLLGTSEPFDGVDPGSAIGEVTFSSVDIEEGDEWKVEVSEDTPIYYEASDCTGFAVGTSSTDACSASFTFSGCVYTTNPSGILDYEDIVYYDNGSGIVPFTLFSPEGYISYFEGATKVWMRLNDSGEVLIKGECANPEPFKVLNAGEYVAYLNTDACAMSFDSIVDLYSDNEANADLGILDIGDNIFILSGGHYVHPEDLEYLVISYMEGATRVWVSYFAGINYATIDDKGEC